MDKNKILECLCIITAIIYSLLVALNMGAEFLAYIFLLSLFLLLGLWAYFRKHRYMHFLQFFYSTTGII